MAISLYDATVAGFLQTLGGMTGVLEKGLSYCVEHDIDPNEIVQARLHDDMLPFAFQVISVAHHSRGAIEGVKAGVFSPPPRPSELAYGDLQALINGARSELQQISPADLDALQGRDVTFTAGERSMPFVAENFLLSFSVPNFYFHAVTAYDILRSKGVPVGKRDYIGQLRVKS